MVFRERPIPGLSFFYSGRIIGAGIAAAAGAVAAAVVVAACVATARRFVAGF